MKLSFAPPILKHGAPPLIWTKSKRMATFLWNRPLGRDPKKHFVSLPLIYVDYIFTEGPHYILQEAIWKIHLYSKGTYFVITHVGSRGEQTDVEYTEFTPEKSMSNVDINARSTLTAIKKYRLLFILISWCFEMADEARLHSVWKYS